MIPTKTVKIQGKLKALEEKIQNKKDDLERFRAQFNQIFKRKRREGEEGTEGESRNE